jgi:hypothetical protein
MSKPTPDHHDAELLIQVYDLRREAVMRESRNAINQQFWPKTYDGVLAITKPDHPLNAAMRQVWTYWEMVYGMARAGIVNADYWAEFNGEGLLLFAKIEPFVEQLRKDFSPIAFRNAEWISRCEMGRTILDRMRTRVEAARQGK